MRQRVAIAAALARDPSLLIADEPSTALDATTQREVLDLLQRLQQARGMALVLITHDLRVAFSVCGRVNVLYAGSIAEVGSAQDVATTPLHPYTRGLLRSEPPLDRKVTDLVGIPGSVPSPDSVAGRCPFSTRCTWATDRCRSRRPELKAAGSGRWVACHHHGDLGSHLADMPADIEETVPAPSPDATAVLLKATDLHVTYDAPRGRKGRAVHALKGVDLSICAGESVGIVGESGSGKTTLGRSIVGLVHPTGGSLTLGGIDATSYTRLPRTQRAELRRAAQIVFQDPYSSLNPVRTIGATLGEALGVRLGRKARPHEIEALLERVRLPASYCQRRPAMLSGGERQRVAIGRAIALEPQLLICDEPVSALDVSVQAQILTLLREIRSELGLALLFITHDLAVVRQITDRIYVMYRGEVVESGPTADVLGHTRHAYTQRLVRSVPGAATTTPSGGTRPSREAGEQD
jgi:peptide/nickel transport system ATP-binding protein